MPLTREMKLISVDDHVVEPPDVWLARVPAKHRDAAPRVVGVTPEMLAAHPEWRATFFREGGTVWQFEGRLYPQTHVGPSATLPVDGGSDPTGYKSMRPGCYRSADRVSDMDMAGIHASLSFPQFPGFSGSTFLEARDTSLAAICVRAWNDFMIGEWCQTAPGRLIPIAILPLWDVSAAAGELDRVLDLGVRAVSMPENPFPLGLPSYHTRHWDPLFARMAEAGVPVCIHFGTSRRLPVTSPDAPLAVTAALIGTNSMAAAVDLVLSGVFSRFPGFKVALSEGGIGWIPYMLERLDHGFEHQSFDKTVDRARRPSEVFREHVFGCFIEDEAGVALRHRIGVENILWESDYPHSDTTWPLSRESAARQLAHVPDDEASAIAFKNAARLFGLDV